MLDHLGFAVRDYDRSKAFYETALAPSGSASSRSRWARAAGFGKDGHASFWIEAQGRPVQGRLHIAFTADSREVVDAFHAAALAAGATDNGAPGVRTMYHPSYLEDQADPQRASLRTQRATPDRTRTQLTALSGVRSATPTSDHRCLE
jgi:catechol 2,3-dioxygenase-like lactoylglutathione lyase family enzyme